MGTLNRMTAFVLVAASTAAAVACSSSDTSSTPAGDAGATDAATAGDSAADTGPALSPTFTNVYTTIISVKCATCHTTTGGSGVTGGMLDMTSQANAYKDLVGAPAAGESCAGNGTRVVAGSPDTSLMYLKIEPGTAAPCGSKMPLGRTPLAQDEADLIKAWITAGALDN